jgi:hypothetical protein
MAKASRLNKSHKIREYLADHPGAGPTEVAKALSEFGVSPALVANIKARHGIAARRERRRSVSTRSRMKPTKGKISQPGRRKKRPKRAGPPLPANSQKGPRRMQHDYDAVLLAVQLIRRCGGVDEAHAVLEKVARRRGDLHVF